MKRLMYSKKTVLFPLIAGFLVFMFVLTPVSQTFGLKKAEAFEIVYDPTNYVANWGTFLSSASTKVSSWVQTGIMSSLQIKEFTLDAIAWGLTNIVIKEMIRSTTRWVRSGFKGSPAFVTDLNGFLANIADKVAGNFIWGTPLSLLCSPFALNIKAALDIQYKSTQSGYVAQCRLSSVIKNMDAFFNGDFMQGGWDGWYSMTLDPSNNPYGAMLQAQSGMSASIASAQGQELKLLEFGRGLLSVKDESGKIITPGVVIETQLNNTLDMDKRRLAVADEINELVGVLFSQLTKELFSGAGGLLGLNEPSNGRAGYLDRMAIERDTLGYVDTSNKPMDSAIIDETKYLSYQQTIINLITDASTYKERVYGREETNVSGTLTSSLRSQLSAARQSASSSAAVIALLTIFKNDNALLQASSTSVPTVALILQKYGATSVPDAQSKLMGQYLTYQASGVLHSPGIFVDFDFTIIPNLKTEIKSFTDSIDKGIEEERERNKREDNRSGE